MIEKFDTQEVLYILKHLALISAAVEQICDDILCSKSLPMGKIMNYRYLCLNLYLWHGYLTRLHETSQQEFAKLLLNDFKLNIYKSYDKIVNLRNCAVHYERDCEMDVMVGIKNGEKFCSSMYLPPYDKIKPCFSSWYRKVNQLIADLCEQIVSPTHHNHFE